MDNAHLRLLSDKFYDKRKAGALELETVIRNSLAEQNHERIAKIVWQLCHDYAYAVHQPHARNGGLIGLAAAAIALGPEVARYLREIVPPVLACFSDQDARVRYYACESMYNIAKVAKGEILIYFNDVFDALSKLAADTELSVKNGAELLDRLIKDIVSESAATYTSVLGPDGKESIENTPEQSVEMPQAFSLSKFIPLLQERVNVQNPWARTFLVQWILLLDSIPDLELVAYLPNFLEGLLTFLGDGAPDVHNATREVLKRFLKEIQKIAEVKQNVADSKRSREEDHGRKASDSSYVMDDQGSEQGEEAEADLGQSRESRENGEMQAFEAEPKSEYKEDHTGDGASSFTAADNEDLGTSTAEDEWIPGQDVHIDYPRITAILVDFLSRSREEEVQLTCLNWIGAFLEICPEDMLPFTPSLLQQLLPALSHIKDYVSAEAKRVNNELMRYIMSLPDDPTRAHGGPVEPAQLGPAVAATTTSTANVTSARALRDTAGESKRESLNRTARKTPDMPEARTPEVFTPEPPVTEDNAEDGHEDLDYEAAVSALTLQFLHEHEATRVAALAWLIMLHRKSPRKILAIQDATFPALLKTLSDPAEAVVTRDLLLLSEISKSSDQSYFTSFMVNLLKLFETDRRLLESRGNLIIRQLCLSLSAERIFRTMADCLEKDEDDVEFASIMVQNLNNNLITAPELAELRRRLRNLDSKEGQSFFTVLFKAWCHNAVATFSLCLLSQAYEQAYNLLLIFSEIEMTVNMLIQIDKLVQLLESPVFTYLRMQLLEPERHPNLCMYGLLMLLPQSSAFAALKNRLNSVSAIGYLHIRDRSGPAPATSSTIGNFGERNRLKNREETGGIRWTELLEKFKATQEKVRRSQQRQLISQSGLDDAPTKEPPKTIQPPAPQPKPEHLQQSQTRPAAAGPPGHQRAKSSLGNLGSRLTGARGAAKAKK
ncbi:putative vacuole morphology and inheritance protein [Septoria linicola]|nr:putative vacuole morphology and inheritance protein [Septoria linicola]